MRKNFIASLVVLLVLCSLAAPAFAYTFQTTGTNGLSSPVVRWQTNTITVAFSSSLSSPPPNIKAGSDVTGALRRALRRWSDVTGIRFVEATSGTQNIARDSVNLISVATDNERLFGGERAGYTSVTYNPADGALVEADIAISPLLPFSTDGTYDTYDLESTFVHEIGHFLGLDHSAIVGATMQPRQGRNYDERYTTARTLSDDDLAGIRVLYNRAAPRPTGALQGRINYGAGAHVFVENAATGRVEGGALTKSDGSYLVDKLQPGAHRVVVEYLDEPVVVRETVQPRAPYDGLGSQPPFQTAEGQVLISAGQTASLDLGVNLAPPTFNPRMFGVNGLITTAPATVAAGRTYKLFIGGEGLDRIPPSGFSVQSPFMRIDPASYAPANFGTAYPVVSFDLKVEDNAKYGDYSIRVRANSGEINYLAGGLALDPYSDFAEPNPLDNNNFLVRQQYLDFLFREPEIDGFNAWLRVLNNCSDVVNNATCDRIIVSGSFFRSQEFQLKGFYVYRFYTVAYGRLPTYAEITPDLQFISGQTADEVTARREQFAIAFAARSDFQRRYNGLAPAAYVDALIRSEGLTTIASRDQLISDLTSGIKSRAQILRAVVESPEVSNKESNPAFVAMQYFGYLKRDPETAGFQAWLNYLNANPTDFRTMVGGFLYSDEHRSRFGQL